VFDRRTTTANSKRLLGSLGENAGKRSIGIHHGTGKKGGTSGRKRHGEKEKSMRMRRLQKKGGGKMHERKSEARCKYRKQKVRLTIDRPKERFHATSVVLRDKMDRGCKGGKMTLEKTVNTMALKSKKNKKVKLDLGKGAGPGKKKKNVLRKEEDRREFLPKLGKLGIPFTGQGMWVIWGGSDNPIEGFLLGSGEKRRIFLL